MRSTGARERDERGFVLPTRLLALCVSAVAMSALVFVANDPDSPKVPSATPAKGAPSAQPTTAAPTPSTPPKPKPKPFKRGEVYVEVYNNTRIKGLAGGVAEKTRAAGWNVVGSDNWYGTFAGSTVYHPPRLREAAKALARDLGINRVRLAEDPMRLDRLTVILTDDYR